MKITCGLDEVGRGALAGPLVLAGVILPEKINFENVIIRDSKKMSLFQRVKAKEFIEKVAIKFEIEIVDVEKINENGIGWGNKQGFLNLIKRIEAEKYIVDGNLKFENKKVESLVKADSQVPEVMCASIIAKCYRDNLMKNLHIDYPNYGWITNVGYGTKTHLEALKKFGVTSHHRTKFINSIFNKYV